jgi:hypothetical protein
VRGKNVAEQGRQAFEDRASKRWKTIDWSDASYMD